MKISVIGTGYVGLVSGTCFSEMGNHVVCVDNNPEKLKKLKNAEIPIYEPGLDILFYRNIAKKRLEFTDDLKHAVLNSQLIFLCLPTPQGEDGSADLQYVFKISDEIGKILKENGDEEFKVIVNKSTVPVGTSSKIKEILEKHGLKNFDVVSNPEFLREGFAVDDFMKPDRIVFGATDERSKQLMRTLYEPFVRQGNPIIEMDPFSSEVTKYASNSYLAMRITFMNELANFCEKVGADVDLVRKGMSTDTRIGKRFLFPGIGYGGSCFPKDVKALTKTSQTVGSEITLLSLVDRINERQKSIIVEKVLDYFGNDIKGKKFAVWGLAFKPNTDDMREAPSLVVINGLLEAGAKVSAYDPAAMENAKFYLKDSIEYAADQYSALENSDALLIITEWNEFRNPEFDKLKDLLINPVIFDGRNIYTPMKMLELGFKYYSIGRMAING
ncbi:MAG: UDP-glucose/GDP-mannose dehydrogenase family protein [Melioribacteraceae bacterium]|nr:UDP-glucose/GDP-mannose dehydrogenase family protein [Melioribacteraceae bacterium]MDD3557209.1 UDP-glucose/GDP-mannose dehydrogenase family protein [Melioribacteraceae bacterium]